MTDNDARFDAAMASAVSGCGAGGIGTLGEKTLHAVLKYYFEPDSTRHEVKIGRYVADIAGEHGIIEIQTRSFNALRPKLAAFLKDNDVTVVYPIPAVKWLCWLDGETGSVTKKRKSPKQGTLYDAFFELYKIKSFLGEPRLHLCFPLLELTEYRNLDGWSTDKKKGASRCDRIPEKLLDVVRFDCASDYRLLIPEDLPSPFTSADFAKKVRIRTRSAQLVLNVLKTIGTVVPCGKKGNAILYITEVS